MPADRRTEHVPPAGLDPPQMHERIASPHNRRMVKLNDGAYREIGRSCQRSAAVINSLTSRSWCGKRWKVRANSARLRTLT